MILFKHGFKVDTQQLNLSGVDVRGMGLAVVACIFSLVGFESATTLGGEAKNPRRNVPRAVIASLMITGLFMVFMAYVEVGGTSNYGGSWTSGPLIYLAGFYGVSFFNIPICIGAMVSFFSLSLYVPQRRVTDHVPMARHGDSLGAPGPGARHRPHAARGGDGVHRHDLRPAGRPHRLFTNPLTAFGDAAHAHDLRLLRWPTPSYTVAAPMYLQKPRASW